MNEHETCTQCGARLGESGRLAGRCPRCLLSFGIDDPELVVTRGHSASPPPTPEELRGHFPELEVLELLGAGGMGAVYRARQLSLDRTVALKILRGDMAEDPAFEERFHREARALARLNHPGIVSVFSSGSAGPFFYLLMEFVDGANLRGVLRSGELAPSEALRVVSQVCDALQYAHGEGVVHRDIKPENILITTDGIVKIADFGLAKLAGEGRGNVSLTETAHTVGTLHYMAPEQIEKPRTVDHRADLYSLGVVFYELLTGELPLGRFMPPSGKVQVDVRLDEVVLKTLAKEPERRYQAASDLKTDVHHISTTAEPKGAKAGLAFGMVAGKGDHVVEMGNAGGELAESLREEDSGGHRSRRERRHERRAEKLAAREARRSRTTHVSFSGCLWFLLFGIAALLIVGFVIALLLAPSQVRMEPGSGSAGVRRAAPLTGGLAQGQQVRPSAPGSPLLLESSDASAAGATEPGDDIAASLDWVVLEEAIAAELTRFPEDDRWVDWVGQRPVREWPRITPKFARALELDAPRVLEANAILESIFQEYLVLEREHVDSLDISPTDVHLRLQVFRGRGKLVAKAHRELSRLAGLNWKREGGKELLEVLMPFGDEAASVWIERTETGYSIRVERAQEDVTSLVGPDGIHPPYSRLFEWFRAEE